MKKLTKTGWCITALCTFTVGCLVFSAVKFINTDAGMIGKEQDKLQYVSINVMLERPENWRQISSEPVIDENSFSGIDGSTATVPVTAELVRQFCGADANVYKYVSHNMTDRAYENLIYGKKNDNGLNEKLRAFTARGGKILATGKSGLDPALSDFRFDFGVRYQGEKELVPSYFRPDFTADGIGYTAYAIRRASEKVKAKRGGKVLAWNENSYFNRTWEHFSSHQYTPNDFEFDGVGMAEGKDGIYIAWPLFSEYAEIGSLICKRVVTFALDRLLGEISQYRTTLPAQGVTTLMHQRAGHRYICHLLYASPVKRGKNVEVI
ncbi:MAG: hypothetical protein ILP22_04895, partial [Oscillospiraceae bacterium]|nr:hypothetical protein [Oscillospiraceae bacterium]